MYIVDFTKPTVKFRVILIQMDLKPYADPVTIFVLVYKKKFKINF